MIVLYGLANCDTCRKARRALRDAGHDVTLRDVRAEPLAPAELMRLHEAFGDRLLNRASATWRQLDVLARAAPVRELIAAHPPLMKRPVIDAAGALHLGWSGAVQRAVLG